MPKKEHEIQIRVYAFDTDCAGAVFNANYFKWFYIGRHKFIESCNAEVAPSGGLLIGPDKEPIAIVVGELKCRIYQPSRINDVINLVTSIKQIDARTITFLHNLYNDNHVLLAQGETTYVAVGPNREKATSLSPSAMDFFESLL